MAKHTIKHNVNINHSMNYTPWIILGVIGALLLIMIFGTIGSYNSLVKLDESVKAQWANVESSYQRRFDLVPNLVETVKGAANFEQETLTAITEARSSWTNAKSSEDKVVAAGSLDSALSRLMVVMENYPELKATQGFQDLQSQLEGTENRINVERNRYNDAVRIYNSKFRSFPTVFIGRMFGFSERESFEAVSGAESAPEVKF